MKVCNRRKNIMKKVFTGIIYFSTFFLSSCVSLAPAALIALSANANTDEHYNPTEVFDSIMKNPEQYSSTTLKQLAEDSYNENNWEQACAYYELLTSSYPDDPYFHCKCGFSYYYWGYSNFDQANTQNKENLPAGFRNEWKAPILAPPFEDTIEYMQESGDIKQSNKNTLFKVYECALDHFFKSLNIEPSWDAYYGIGLTYCCFGNFPEGEYSNGVLCYSGSTERAEIFFLKSLELSPSWEAYYALVTQIYSTNFNYYIKLLNGNNNVLKLMNNAIDFATKTNAPLDKIGNLYHCRGMFYANYEKKYDLALNDYKKAEELSNKNYSSDISKLETIITDTKIAKEKGFPSLKAYYDDLKLKQLAEERVSFDNFYDEVIYSQGIPLKEGDIFKIDTGYIKVIDRIVDKKGIVYLMTFASSVAQKSIEYANRMTKPGYSKKCFYVVTADALHLKNNSDVSKILTKEVFMTTEYPLKLEYVGKATYESNFQDVECYTFIAEEIK